MLYTHTSSKESSGGKALVLLRALVDLDLLVWQTLRHVSSPGLNSLPGLHPESSGQAMRSDSFFPGKLTNAKSGIVNILVALSGIRCERPKIDIFNCTQNFLRLTDRF